MRTRTPLGITSVRSFECTAHTPAGVRICELRRCPKALSTGGGISAAPVPMVRPRDVGCLRRCNRPPMRASDHPGGTSDRRRDPLRPRKGAWQSRRDRGLGRLRHGVWRRWIEGRRWLWRRRVGIKRLCMCDRSAEQGHPSGHENPRQRHPLKSRRLHRGLLRAHLLLAQRLWIDNTTIDTAVPAASGRRRPLSAQSVTYCGAAIGH
jgi:hypothetical protein